MNQAVSNEINEKCVEWHQCIKDKDLINANRLKIEIQQRLQQSKVDHKVISFFGIIDYKHWELEKKAQALLNQDEEAEKEHITNYLNDSSNRQRQMNKKCCHSAIVYYQIADKKPIQGTDCFEKAEFFHQMANVYYALELWDNARLYQEKYLDELKRYPPYATVDLPNH